MYVLVVGMSVKCFKCAIILGTLYLVKVQSVEESVQVALQMLDPLAHWHNAQASRIFVWKQPST